MARKSWTERLNGDAPHELRRMARDTSSMKKGELALPPTARMIDDFIRAIPKGKTVSILDLRKRLARKHGADVTCPVYTGYHLRTVAEAACEARGRGAPGRYHADLAGIGRERADVEEALYRERGLDRGEAQERRTLRATCSSAVPGPRRSAWLREGQGRSLRAGA